MMTTQGLKTYDGLTKKYPWLKVTTGEVEHGQRFKPQDPEDAAALEHRLVEDPGLARALRGATRPLVELPRSPGPLARRALSGPARA